jgi:Holliday junction resolvase
MTNDELFDGSNAHLMTHVVPVGDLREHITDGQSEHSAIVAQVVKSAIAFEVRYGKKPTRVYISNAQVRQLEKYLSDRAYYAVRGGREDAVRMEVYGLHVYEVEDNQPHIECC